jgi:hypothetical protein
MKEIGLMSGHSAGQASVCSAQVTKASRAPVADMIQELQVVRLNALNPC